ncbi:MAG: hypothetical protein KGI32_07255 [Gammaproteobacteria bacterium]|nr:hypothetical protein [Gammaproteobacteria bacterium]
MLHISQIKFDTAGLELKQDDANCRFWVAPGPTLVQQTLIMPTDFSCDLRNPAGFREELQKQAQSMGSALIQCDFFEVQGLSVARVINKFWSSPAPEDPNLGKDYNSSLIFPLAEGCFYIRVAAQEQGTTGVRESMVTMLLHKQGKLELSQASRPAGNGDGLGTILKKQALVPSPSDDERYDVDFPEHPLTRVRRLLKHISGTLTIATELKNAKPYRV